MNTLNKLGQSCEVKRFSVQVSWDNEFLCYENRNEMDEHVLKRNNDTKLILPRWTKNSLLINQCSL